MERLSGLDAMFFYLESPSSHMHVAGICEVDPGHQRVSFEAIRQMVAERLPLAPVFRRRLVEVPFKLTHPYWVEDPDFDLDYHVRRAALPAPGGRVELEAFVGQVVGLPLDRSRPLWEMYVVEGVEGGRLAIVTKIHHAAIDGISGAEIAAAWLDIEPHPMRRDLEDDWEPEPLPSDVELTTLALASLVGQPLKAARSARRVLESALSLSEHNRQLESPPPVAFAAPKTSLNRAITPHRRVAFTERPLAEFETVKNHFSCKLNDVVLAVCAGALRRYLLVGEELPSESLAALVPISVRTEEEAGSHGNKISATLTSLATEVEDPAERLSEISAAMARAKEQQRLIGAGTLTDWTEFTSPALIARASRLVTTTRLFDKLRPICNVTISNIAGPSFPLFFAGGEVASFYPLGPVAEGIGLNITVLSYHGSVYFGLNACRESVARLSELPGMLDESMDELVSLARRGRRGRRSSPAALAGD